MTTIEWKKQTGFSSKALRVNLIGTGDKALMTALADEAAEKGRTVQLKAHVHDNDDDAYINQADFGLSPDVAYTDLTGDQVYGSILPAGSTLMGLFVKNKTKNAISLNIDIVAGGTDLAADAACNALPSGSMLDYAATYISIEHAVGAVAETLYIWSADWNGAELDIEIKITA